LTSEALAKEVFDLRSLGEGGLIPVIKNIDRPAKIINFCKDLLFFNDSCSFKNLVVLFIYIFLTFA
jgi:hypothetical protein